MKLKHFTVSAFLLYQNILRKKAIKGIIKGTSIVI